MSTAWYISPPHEGMCRWIEKLGVAPPPVNKNAVSPTPQQVLCALEAFPEYRVALRRRSYRRPEKKDVQQSIIIDLRREDGSFAIEIDLLRVIGDDQPAWLIFERFGKTDELVRIVAKLAEVCGPLLLLHDSAETPLVVYPTIHGQGPGSGKTSEGGHLERPIPSAVVVVKPDQVPWVLGRRGENRQLASELSGWQIELEEL